MTSDLHRRAREAGIVRDWVDAGGTRRRVADDTLAAILEALGDIEPRADPPLITADVGKPVRLPSGRRLPAFAEPGYHELDSVTVAVAPQRAWSLTDAAPGRRIWAPAVQLPSLRDRRGAAFGDFTALGSFAAAAGGAGADALAISPVHALFPADSGRFGPYGPSSRLFLNVLLADPGDVGPSVSGPLIDWAQAIPDRMERLRRRYRAADAAERAAVAAFRRERGEALERHACFDAIHARFLDERGAHGWTDWPAGFRDAASPAVTAFARDHEAEVGFHIFLQWLADRQLADAQEAARSAGMAVGLIADLAVGVDPGGSQAWSAPDVMLTGLTIGAPPDPLGPDGQNWGITTFSPHALRRTGFGDYIATLRAVLRHAGGIRIDHALGLKRLWVVPDGFPATEGAFLRNPEQDLVRLLAIESRRARAIVVGEDLGTIPPGFREAMAERGIFGMRVLWFQRTAGGGYQRPGEWDRGAAAMTTTHDLPTVAGWWCGRDIDWTWRIGRSSGFASAAAERAARTTERRCLWRTIGDGGPAPPPDEPQRVVTAAIDYVGRSAGELALIPAEDLAGEVEQPNLPGTVDEHPNWRRRLSLPVEDFFAAPQTAERVALLNAARS